MKRISFVLLLLYLCWNLSAMTIPRVYYQKLILKNGSMPEVTMVGKTSAKEYTLKAYIIGREDDFLSTDYDPIHSIAVKKIGNGKTFPFQVVAYVQLGNFRNQWKAGENLHLELIHKATKQKVSWDIYIPEGTNVINKMKTPQIIPPFPKK